MTEGKLQSILTWFASQGMALWIDTLPDLQHHDASYTTRPYWGYVSDGIFFGSITNHSLVQDGFIGPNNVLDAFIHQVQVAIRDQHLQQTNMSLRQRNRMEAIPRSPEVYLSYGSVHSSRNRPRRWASLWHAKNQKMSSWFLYAAAKRLWVLAAELP